MRKWTVNSKKDKVHLEELFLAACDNEILELTSVDYSVEEIFYSNFNNAMDDREKGRVYPFVIIQKQSYKIIGDILLSIFN